MEELNQWLTLLANVGVLIGIGFLAYEIRQNTKATHAQTREAVLAGRQVQLAAVREDPNLIKSLIKQDPLTDDEQIKLFTWLTSALSAREFSWLQWKSGVIDETQWQSELAVLRGLLQAPTVRLWWKNVGHITVSSEFRQYVDSQMEDLPPSHGIFEAQTKWANLST